MMRKAYKPFDRLNWFWACAWYDFNCDTAICYPLGIHWIMRWGRTAHIWLFRRWKPTWWESQLSDANQKGRRYADERYRKSFETEDIAQRMLRKDARRDSYEKGWDAGLKWMAEGIGKPEAELKEMAQKSFNEAMR